MREYLKFYIDGKWVDPVELKTLDVENPATEEVCGRIALGSAADVDKAVKAARKAFESWSQTSREERIEVLGRILAEYQKRFGDLATAVTEEMGAPASLAQRAQVPAGMGHLMTAANILKDAHERKENWCEWIYSCYKCDPLPAVRNAIKTRHTLHGCMADYPTALAIVRRAVEKGEHPLFASWF